MSGFSFGFSGDDIEDEDLSEVPVQTHIPGQSDAPTSLIPPRSHTLQELLDCLPSHISFSYITIGNDQQQFKLPRRELFDVRTQLMAEDAAENDDLLAGLDQGDLTSGVYEGGFKTWECSLDLAQVASDSNATVLSSAPDIAALHCVELGAGTAVASMAVLAQYLAMPDSQRQGGLHLTVCDYNEAVLRLVTLPNLLLTWHCSQGATNQEGELEIDENLKQQLIKGLQISNISLDFISGAWSQDLTDLILQASLPAGQEQRLVLASETIYSPLTVDAFTDILYRLLEGDNEAIALVAAKKIYFGVGGGVDDFCRRLEERGIRYETILDVPNVGVGRIVIKIW